MSSSPLILRTASAVRAWRLEKLINKQSVGFVATMGALHEGHLSLVNASLAENDATIVSIFVNPSQFAPTEDLDSYPRTLDSDLQLLTQLSHSSTLKSSAPHSAPQSQPQSATTPRKVEAVFLPSVSEMYPSGISTHKEKQFGAFVSVRGLSEQLEGAARPQFFTGVATIVTKLFNVVSPTVAYFGQKDIQQTVVVKRLVKDLLIDTEIRVVPTARDSNGLALSSRNAYMSPEIRISASILYKALTAAEERLNMRGGKASGAEIRQAVLDVLRGVMKEDKEDKEDKKEEKKVSTGSDFYIDLEYVSVNDKETLEELDVVYEEKGAIVSLAARVPNGEGREGTTRLIDNIVL